MSCRKGKTSSSIGPAEAPPLPSLPTGQVAPADGSTLYRIQQTPTVTIGGIAAPVSFSGIVPGTAGEYQINLTIPSGVPVGDQVPIIASIGGSSDTVGPAIRPTKQLNEF